MKRNAPEEFAAQAGIHPARTNQTQLTRHDVHYAPAARNESHPEGLRSQTNVREHSEKPSKHRLARLQVTKATCKTSEGHTFRSKLPLGKHRQLVRKSKPTRWQLPEGHAFRKAPSTGEAQATSLQASQSQPDGYQPRDINFRKELPLGERRQLVGKSKPTERQQTEGHSFSQGPLPLGKAQATCRNPADDEEECTSGVRCTGRDPSNSHKPITTHAPRRTLCTSPPKRITPRRTKKPDERAKTFREAEQAPVSANASNKRNRQLSRDILFATSFH